MLDFGLRLRHLRTQKGYSLSQLASKLNLTKSAVFKYEDGLTTPSLDTL
jgi:transcriptional regulator with XRE-family HTH domain